jgi:Ca2+-binding RTX toxin-like protein
MRVRNRWTSAAAAATLVVGGALASVAVATPASAALVPCLGEYVSLTITWSGNVTGSPGHDVVLISAGGVTYDPGGGESDTICITASAGATVWASGWANKISGGPGPDIIYGSEGPDSIWGGDGNDLIKGNGGVDRIQGGWGDDYLRGNAGGTNTVTLEKERIWGGPGNDCIAGGWGYEILSGEEGDDTILLGYDQRFNSLFCAPAEGDNSAAAVAFRNNLDGNGGAAAAGPGNDRVWGSNGVDDVNGDDGDDIVWTWNGNDTIFGGPGTDILQGGAGVDTVVGGGGSGDQVYGGTGAGDLTYGDSTDTCFPDTGPATQPCAI